MITIAYCTSRKEPKIQWFLDSLQLQLKAHPDLQYRIVVVDHWYGERQLATIFAEYSKDWPNPIIFTKPMPNVWNGDYRLTKENWFNAAATRTTALCYAPDGLIAYVDDLSVLLPGWLDAALQAIDYIACGAYKKVLALEVEKGVIKSFKPHPPGEDNRLKLVSADVYPCDGRWLYGCSVAGPVEAFLSVNGWPVDLCGGLGFEDCIMGIVLENAGWKLRYDRRMMTYESEELHHAEPAFRREDWHFENGIPVTGGNGADDKSHRALNIAQASKMFPNSFGEGGIRELRRRALLGEPLPVVQVPDREWFTSKLLSEL